MLPWLRSDLMTTTSTVTTTSNGIDESNHNIKKLTNDSNSYNNNKSVKFLSIN